MPNFAKDRSNIELLKVTFNSCTALDKFQRERPEEFRAVLQAMDLLRCSDKTKQKIYGNGR
jgi:hypothetical protein